MLALSNKTYQAEAAAITAGGPPEKRSLFGNGLSGRKLIHAGKFAAGMALGSEGGEIGSAAGMALMVDGAAGVAVGGVMLIAGAYHNSVEQAKKLNDEQREYEKSVRSTVAWWKDIAQLETTSTGGKYRGQEATFKEAGIESVRKMYDDMKNTSTMDRLGATWSVLAGKGDPLKDRLENQLKDSAEKFKEQDRFKQFAEDEDRLWGKRYTEGSAKSVESAKIGSMSPGPLKERAEREFNLSQQEKEMEQRHADALRLIDKRQTVASDLGHTDEAEQADKDCEEQIRRLQQDRDTFYRKRNEIRKGQEAGFRRQELAEKQSADETMIGATERGYAATLDISKSKYDYERNLAIEGGKSTLALDHKYKADVLAIKRDQSDKILSLGWQTQKMEIGSMELGLTAKRDLINAEYEERIANVTDPKERAAINRQWKAADNAAIRDDAKHHGDTMRALKFQEMEAAAITADEKEAIRKKEIYADAKARGQSEGQAQDLVKGEEAVFSARRKAEGIMASRALHPMKQFEAHKKELDSLVKAGGMTKDDEQMQLRQELRQMQGTAGQFFGSAMERWKSMQTAVANPQETAAEQLQLTRQLVNLLSGHGSIRLRGGY